MVANWEGKGAIAPSCPYVAPPLAASYHSIDSIAMRLLPAKFYN